MSENKMPELIAACPDGRGGVHLLRKSEATMNMQYYVRADLVNDLLDLSSGTVKQVVIDEHMVYDAIMSFSTEAMTIDGAFEQIKKAFGRK